MLDRLKYAAFALGGIVSAVAVTLLCAQFFMVPAARREGRESAIAARAIEDGKAELERKGDDASLQKSSDYDLCVIGLRGNGMRIDACDQLRGLPEKQP
ncbi:hypothetical protein [Agrobacterium larrymoorei]|uniref:Uncharacterized protein n=1 Tax=Agrobacterium larrymoorei TaxID=160699 RepID=A0ABU0ULT4_9HYPH|nr:hypothetical protein [Agrobacterium larrymoorei]MDQ1185927.1 hypothetical protein [Agrobacterium larrymoorei]